MILLFLVTLWGTLLLTRIIATSFHDRETYGTPWERSKTLTGLLRKKTGFDLHHYHFGGIILLIVAPLILLNGISNTKIFFLAVSLSFIGDQLIPLFWKIDYFYTKGVFSSILMHILISLVAIALLFFL